MKKLQHTGTYELLSTKLTPPRLSSSLVSREQLLARLDQGLEHKLTLLSAPAGFGKTTLVSEWIATRGERQDLPPVAWISLDTGDNDPVRFWRYVISACQAFDAGLGRSALALLHTSQRPSFEAVLTAFINDLAQLAGRGVLVLEDYHVITSRQVHETLAFLLDHLPTTLHLLMITRSDPPLPLPRLRAHDDLSELHSADLRFSLADTQAFLQQAIPFPLSAEITERLQARTEGWVTGLRLLAFALQGRQEPHDIEHLLVTFTGSHRHILEYFVADVLFSQPAPLQEFLLQTTVLTRLTGSLCDAVTGRSDSELILEQLERANLFLLPLDGAGQWYRYHSLFAEAMQHEARRHFGESGLCALFHKASLWYERHGLLAEAVEASLSAQAFEHAAVLIERIIEPYSAGDELHTMRRWIEQLPEEVLRAHPALCLSYAIAILFTFDRSAPTTRMLLEPPLEMAEQCWRAEGNRHKLGAVLAFRSQVAWWQGDIAQAFSAARQALELLPQGETEWHAVSMIAVGIEELLAGRIDAARQATLEARALFEASGNFYGARATIFVLGEACSKQGELHQAARLYRQLLAEAGEDLLDRGYALIGLAALSYEWNELGAAEDYVSQALDIGKQHAGEIGEYHAEGYLLVPGSLIMARVLHARGETAQAQQRLSALVTLTQQRKWPLLYREVLACQAQLQLAIGNLAAVQRWSTTCAQPGEDIPLVQQEREDLLVARLLIAQRKAGAALRLLERWQVEAHVQGRMRSELEIRVLTALAHFAHNNLPQARQALKEALALALVEGYQRLFLDEGEVLATLLRAVLSDVREEPLGTYMRTLLLAFAQQRSGQVAVAAAVPGLLIEPLSTQEQRVLRLLAAGLSNPEIAQEMIVSINTIKTQVQSIYRKLNVNSRKEARDTARQLKLL